MYCVKYKDSLRSNAVVSMAIKYKYSTVLPVWGRRLAEAEFAKLRSSDSGNGWNYRGKEMIGSVLVL